MKKILVNYNFTPDKEFVGDDYLIYDRSDDGIDHLTEFDQSKIIKTANVGQVDYDKLCYLVDHYDTMPDVFLWGKTNLFAKDHLGRTKFITQEEYEKVKDSKVFTPLLTSGHETYSDGLGPVCYYDGPMYYERKNVWNYEMFANRYVKNWDEWADIHYLPKPYYIPFAPGGNYILTREVVHKYARDYYENMLSMLNYAREPAEAYLAERSYYLMWK